MVEYLKVFTLMGIYYCLYNIIYNNKNGVDMNGFSSIRNE